MFLFPFPFDTKGHIYSVDRQSDDIPPFQRRVSNQLNCQDGPSDMRAYVHVIQTNRNMSQYVLICAAAEWPPEILSAVSLSDQTRQLPTRFREQVCQVWTSQNANIYAYCTLLPPRRSIHTGSILWVASSCQQRGVCGMVVVMPSGP